MAQTSARTSVRQMSTSCVQLAHPVGYVKPFSPLGLAGAADPKYLKAVMQRLELEFFADGFLHGFQVWLEEFDDGITIQANQMIMVLITMDSLVMGMLVPKALLANQSALDQQVQSPVDGGTRNLIALLSQRQMKAVGIEVVLGSKDRIQKCFSFTGVLEFTTTKKGFEATLLFRMKLFSRRLGFDHWDSQRRA